MKNTLLSLAAVTALCCSCSSDYNFSGQVTGAVSDTVLVYRSDFNTGKWLSVDTLSLSDGRFETSLPDSVPFSFYLSAKCPHGQKGPQILSQPFFFFPGDKLEISGDLPYGLEAKGTEIYNALTKNEKLRMAQKRLAELERAIAQTDDEDAAVDSLNLCYDRVQDEIYQLQFEMIQAQPNSLVAGYLVQDLDAERGLKAVALLSDDVKNGVMGQLIREYAEEYQRDADIAAAEATIELGKRAPAFTLADRDNRMVTLNDFKGKYVVLDFWGTWCGWCLAGIPQMKTYYEKYHHQVEFVGICCADQKKRWLNCLDQEQMAWVNVIDNPEMDMPLKYGVSGFPTKFIIDEEGKIEKIFEGESQEFYDYLDRLFCTK